MYRKIIILTLFFLPLFVVSQENRKKIDSLIIGLKNGVKSEKFRTLNALSDEYSNSNLIEAMRYAKLSLSEAKSLGNEKYISLAYNSIANIFQYQSKLDSALVFNEKALLVRKKIKDSIGIADSYNNLGITFDQKGNYPDALKNYFKALYCYEKKKDIEKQAMVNSNIGIVYKTQKEYSKALIYYKKSYNLYVSIKNDFGITVSSGNLGSLLIDFKNYNESLQYSKIAKEGYEKLGYDRYIGYPVSNIAAVYDSLHQFKKANSNYIEAIRLFEKFENGFEVANISKAYANCLIKQENFSESILMSQKAIEFGKKSDAFLILVEAYENLSRCYAMTGNYNKAYTYSRLYTKGKDSLFKNEKTKAVFQLETKYQTEKKEKLLIKKEAESKKKSTWLIIISLLTIFTGVIGFLIYRQQKQKNLQQEQEHQLKNAIVQIETQNKLQDQRIAISRDLHDNIGSQLTFIISSVDNVKHGFNITNEKLDNKLTNISSFAKDTILELRDTIWAMNSNEITFEDLEVRINNYIEKAKDAKEKISFSFAIDESLKFKQLSSVEGMNIYRTIQEAINNTIKYAQADIISVNIKKQENQIKIAVTDNGIGFNIETIEKGNGLHNMKKRIEEIGGKFDLTSSNEGTKIEILI